MDNSGTVHSSHLVRIIKALCKKNPWSRGVMWSPTGSNYRPSRPATPKQQDQALQTAQVDSHTHTHTQTNSYSNTKMHTYVYACMHACIHTYMIYTIYKQIVYTWNIAHIYIYVCVYLCCMYACVPVCMQYIYIIYILYIYIIYICKYTCVRTIFYRTLRHTKRRYSNLPWLTLHAGIRYYRHTDTWIHSLSI